MPVYKGRDVSLDKVHWCQLEAKINPYVACGAEQGSPLLGGRPDMCSIGSRSVGEQFQSVALS